MKTGVACCRWVEGSTAGYPMWWCVWHYVCMQAGQRTSCHLWRPGVGCEQSTHILC